MARGFSVRRQSGFGAIAFLCFFLLYAPIAVLVIFSFNAGTNLATWEGFSLRWYQAAWNNEIVIDASLRSLLIATVAATLATIAATMAALATTRGKPHRGRQATYAFINLPLMVPEIVTGVALLILFASIKIATGYDGLGFLIAAHTGFCVPFAYLPIRARLETWISRSKPRRPIFTPRPGKPSAASLFRCSGRRSSLARCLLSLHRWIRL